MSDYHRQWKEAKAQYERDTGGARKPAPMGKVPILGISYRKGTEIDETLKRIDILIPANMLDGIDQHGMAKLQSDINSLDAKANMYFLLLDKEIKEEGASAGKFDSRYRDLKIMRDTLRSLTANVKLDMQKLIAANTSRGQKLQVVSVAIDTAAEGLSAKAQEGVAWGQQILRRPDCAAFNKEIYTKARNITQQLANLRKWTMPDEIGPDGKLSRDKALAKDPELLRVIEKMYHQVAAQGLKDDILALLRKTGSDTVVNASLQDLGNEPSVKLPTDSTQQDVVAATKYFMRLAKAAIEISKAMRGLSARIRVPDSLTAPPPAPPQVEEEEMLAPDFQAPLAPQRLRAHRVAPKVVPPHLRGMKPLPTPPAKPRGSAPPAKSPRSRGPLPPLPGDHK